MNINLDLSEIELEESCPCCEGVGKENCYRCYGRGKLLTAFGEKLLKLVMDWAPWEAALQNMKDDIKKLTPLSYD